MLKLTSLILLFGPLISAKIIKNRIELSNENEKPILPNPWDIKAETKCKIEDKLWIFNLYDDTMDFKRIMLANEAEETIFKKVMLPTIRNYETSSVRKKQDHFKSLRDEHELADLKEITAKNENTDNLDIQNEFLVIMNKFFLNHLEDPDIYFDEIPSKHMQRSLKLYFKGPYTSLIMTSGKNIYQYFINPSSPLPKWFSKTHENALRGKDGKYVEIPENVRYTFMKQLLNQLKMYFSFPV